MMRLPSNLRLVNADVYNALNRAPECFN